MKLHTLRVGDKITTPAGWDAQNEENPQHSGVVIDLYGPNQWPRVQFDHKAYGDLQTCVSLER